jgi:hypothetical protein
MWTNELIFELVAKIDDPKDVLARHDVTVAQLKVWKADPVFIQQFKEARAFWNSNSNTKERIVTKALAMLEDSLMGLFAIANSSGTATGARLEAVKQIAGLAKVDGGERAALAAEGALIGGGGGPSVVIQINLDKATHGGGSIEKEINPVVTEGTQPITAADISAHAD